MTTMHSVSKIDDEGVTGEGVQLDHAEAVPARPILAFTTGATPRGVEVTNIRIVTPIRAEDYPALAAIWDNEEDDDIFADENDL